VNTLPVVLAEKSAEMDGAVGAGRAPRRGLRNRRELLVGLLVEILAVGHDHERPVSGCLRSTFWEKNSIDSVFPDPWGVPEHAELPALLGWASRSSCIVRGVVDADRGYWWFRASSLTKPAWTVLEGMKVLDQDRARRSFVHMPRITVSSENIPSRPRS